MTRSHSATLLTDLPLEAEPPSDRARRIGAALALTASLAVGGCGASEPAGENGEHAPPTWHHLVEQYDPDPGDLPRHLADGDGWSMRLASTGDALWLEVHFGAEAWTRTPVPGVWSTPRVVPVSALSLGSTVGARTNDVALERLASSDVKAVVDVPTGVFTFLGTELVVSTGEPDRPPADLALSVKAPLGRPDGARWSVESTRFAGDGFVVLPGTTQSFTLPAGAERELSFGWFAGYSEGEREALRFEIAQDGAVLWSDDLETDTITEDGHLGRARVRLADTEQRTELEFRVRGSYGFPGFASPVVGPALDPDALARPLDGRPNLVLFVADTLRADVFEHQRRYQDSPPDSITYPALEALADESRVFINSWSSSSWTLPSHASMFTSLLPLQHGATQGLGTLSRRAITVAEVLRDAGYRTVAVTDGTYVTSLFGLAQGFESFDQVGSFGPAPLDRARAALEHGDGRPTFLFVQSYYPHSPFEPSDAARATVGIGADEPRWAEVFERSGAIGAHLLTLAEPIEDPTAVDLRNLYRAQVVDFDAEFARFVEDFESTGWRASSHLFFTSDHGESFGDHGHLFHVGRPWESQVRVPLLWSGPDVPHEWRDDVASSIDLAPTLAALAGVDAPDVWRGRDLAPADAAAVAWSAVHLPRDTRNLHLARTEPRLKLVASLPVDGDPERFAFDLADDPDELRPIDVGARDWPTLAAERFDAALDDVRDAILPQPALREAEPSLLEQLERMGYADD